MSEAERSIAIKRKIAIAKPISREDSPSEVYTPKRRRSETGKVEVSPPPYIPSKKESSSSRSRTSSQDDVRHSSSKDDARQLLEKRHSRISLPAREHRELISRSRRIELFQKLGIDREETLGERHRRVKENDKDTQKRESERDIPEVRNFKVTAHITPSSRPTETVKQRLAKPVGEKDRSFQVTVLPSSSIHKSSIASRLGKVVIHRRLSNYDTDKEVELKDKDTPTVRLSSSRGRRLALSLLGKEVVKRQCEAAVLSVKSVSARKYGPSEARDSRVVESHSSSDEEVPVPEKSPVEIVTKQRDSISIKSERDSLDKDSEDLDEMLKDDLEPDLLQDTFTDEFTLDLEDDEDLIKVVGQLEEEDTVAGREKSEHKSGTRFIVTLDGVDERQFEGNQEKPYPNYLPPTPTQPVLPVTSPSPHVPIIPLPQDQATGVFLHPQDPLAAATPTKAAPPKIQPFSINLKDSDDEFEEKTDPKFSKLMGYPQPPQPVGRSPVVEATEGLTTLQKAKMSERCKYWPACAAGSECEFHHPTSYCKTFPNCKFGEKCLFIHPNCKFDSKCTRIDCPFTHISRRPVLGASPQAFKSPLPKASPYYPQYIPFNNTPSSTVCKFFPNCQNIACPFIHPKPCRFGVLCQNASCPFFHPSTPTKDKLKWTANADQQQQVKEGMTIVPTPLPTSKPKVTTPMLAGCAADSSTSV